MQIKNRIKELRQVKASELLPNPRNWRRHPASQSNALRGILAEVGYADALIAYETPDGLMLIDGHLRAETTPDVEVPVLVTDLSEQEADKLLATLDPLAAMAEQDTAALSALLGSMATDNDMLSNLLEQMRFDITAGTMDDARGSLKQPHDKQARTLPIDMYITGMKTPYCCLAVIAGMGYGIRSTETDGRRKDPTACEPFFGGRHRLQFIDNDFLRYDHAFHVDYVKQYSPRYATVRDLMTERQCRDASVEFYSFNQVMEFADEVGQYAERVIVIPKYDCLDTIPSDFILGYSIPTRYGGTPLPIEAFKGRPVHLLGGSWTQQRNALEILGDGVVSVDNNQIQLMANHGSFYAADGSVRQLSDIGLGSVTNPGVIAFAMSAGGMAAGLKELMGETIMEEEQEVGDDASRDEHQASSGTH
jgi:hypothetical protein